MRMHLILIALLVGCQGVTGDPDDLERAPATSELVGALAARAAAADPGTLQQIFHEVDGGRIVQVLRELAGVDPVALGGQTVTLGQRFDSDGRKRFRAYFSQTMRGLGMEINEMQYQAARHPRPGNNVEAILRGASPDSFIVIVHYDSIGPRNHETENPGVDDDMSGMAILFETARLFAAHRAQLPLTVRFVASDEEELGGLAGARNYAAYIKALSQREGFALVGAIDDEQTGWNCSRDNLCGDNTFPSFDIFSCGSGAGHSFDFAPLGDQFEALVHTFSPLNVTRGCLGQQSDHFAMWEIGVPAVVYSEHNPFANPHFDREGGDTFETIDTDYLVAIARPAITFQAALVGLRATDVITQLPGGAR
ncbi:MAG TPA: M20/M25/M40 family metallo-hydrolase [Kofleriaceae bacterium]|nr:M20/M25/M40 family metallo-hydrolase [Kofleriaceae bacterium]